MPALTGQCKRCSQFGPLFPARGIYYCRPCGETFERHLQGYEGPNRRETADSTGTDARRRRWSDLPSAARLDLFALRTPSA